MERSRRRRKYIWEVTFNLVHLMMTVKMMKTCMGCMGDIPWWTTWMVKIVAAKMIAKCKIKRCYPW